MMHRLAAGTSLAALLLLFGSVPAADELKSGPQVGETVDLFEPLVVTGEDAGQKRCLV